MFMNREQKYHFPIGRRQKNNHCCSWIVNKTENSAKSAWKTYITSRNANKSNTTKDICMACVHFLRTRDVDCILSGVQKSILFRGKFFSNVEKHFVSQKNFFGALVVKSILSHKQKNIWYWCIGQKKSALEKIDS